MDADEFFVVVSLLSLRSGNPFSFTLEGCLMGDHCFLALHSLVLVTFPTACPCGLRESISGEKFSD